MLQAIAGILSAAGALLVPPRCWGCRELAPAGEPLCRPCSALLPWLSPMAPLPGGSPVGAAWAALSYEGVARDLVHALKFAGAPGVAPAMAGHLCDSLPPRAFPREGCLVPVPPDRWRSRRRGFDHATALARALGERTGLPVAQPLRRRPAAQSGQRGLGRSARLAGRGIRVEACGTASPACVLVDDVLTTGATASACARELLRNGAISVVFVAYCRVL